ncbi:hypothetical protein CHARACLAT_007914 [Characodon lateralis]|uniref:Uncharacterized protein n=1 Tax=Characodon lateralis TaxID=208331 RepID=A0ABU7ERS8_9TELE|nr:hypothetical protein [Characodon lateralis]
MLAAVTHCDILTFVFAGVYQSGYVCVHGLCVTVGAVSLDKRSLTFMDARAHAPLPGSHAAMANNSVNHQVFSSDLHANTHIHHVAAINLGGGWVMIYSCLNTIFSSAYTAL